jgi:nitrogen fixation/metabolism regulation signal transduction histidine kinase
MSAVSYAILGLSVLTGVLVAILMFAVLRFASAARHSRRSPAETRESAVLASALEDAIQKLKAQERATAARAEASERLSEQIVASLTSGLIGVDRDGTVRIVNPAAQRILPLPALTPGLHYRELLREAPTLASVIAEALETNAPALRRTATVNQTHLGVGVSPLSADGAPTGVICLFTDLTKVVTLEEQLYLKDSLARLGELTAGLAHEFRNGLATIHGYGRLLDPAMLPGQYRPYVEGIRNETKALGEVVRTFSSLRGPNP